MVEHDTNAFALEAVDSLGDLSTSAACTWTINALAQTIAFVNPGAQTVGTPLKLTATTTSGLAVRFTSTTTGVCAVSGTTATFVTSGTCAIDATQAGDSAYTAAPMVEQSFAANTAPPPSFTIASPGRQPIQIDSPASSACPSRACSLRHSAAPPAAVVSSSEFGRKIDAGNCSGRRYHHSQPFGRL